MTAGQLAFGFWLLSVTGILKTFISTIELAGAAVKGFLAVGAFAVTPLGILLIAAAEAALILYYRWDTIKTAVESFWNMLKAFARWLESDFQVASATPFGAAFVAVTELITHINDLIKTAKDAATAVGSIFGGGGASDSAPLDGGNRAAIPSHAAGGYIRGPGTGISDSILAHVSNGEFIMNAAATARIGVPTLNAWNRGFAFGGLINVPRLSMGGIVGDLLPSFAEGGLALSGAGGGSSSGTPVHLHIGDRTYETRANQDVATSLVRHARRLQISSGGKKPGWFES